MAKRDWFDWHSRYDDPGSALSGRLDTVRRRIADALDDSPSGRIRVVSMCAGQGRDLLGVLVEHPRRGDVEARLVELDPRNAERAAAAAEAAGLDRVEVVVGDAGTTTAYDGAVPAHLVLVCGVFGHASDEEINRLVGVLPTLCAPGATVIWTRGGFKPDLRPTIRRWFRDEGFEEVGFDAEDLALDQGEGVLRIRRRSPWGVGANRLVAAPRPHRPGVRLFSFRDDLRGSPTETT